MRALVVLLVVLLLPACGDDPAPAPTPPPLPKSETWFLSPEEVARLIQSQDPGGIAWIPAEAQARTDLSDLGVLKRLTEMLGKTVVARLTLVEDGTHVFDLRAQDPDGAWRTVKTTGPWRESEGTITLEVTKRTSKQIAPLEVPDAITVQRVGRYLHLSALGRTIPLEKRAM